MCAELAVFGDEGCHQTPQVQIAGQGLWYISYHPDLENRAKLANIDNVFSLKRATLLLMAVCLLASCGKDEAKEPEFLPPDPNATTIPPDPWAVPEQIDVAYAQRVTQKLLDIEGEVRADVFNNLRFTDISKKKVAAIYDGDLFDVSMQRFNEYSMTGSNDLIKNPPGRIAEIKTIISSSKTCFYVIGDATDKAHKSGIQHSPYGWAAKHDPTWKSSTNPTGWKFIFQLPSSQAEDNPCV